MTTTKGKRKPVSTPFSRNIVALRKAMGVTQREVASGVGVDLKAYQQWEYGYAKPSDLHLFIRLANFHQFFDLYALISRDLNEDELSLSIEPQGLVHEEV